MAKPSEPPLEKLVRKANDDLRVALESLRDALSELDRQLQKAMAACTDALTGAEFKLDATGIVQGAGGRIDSICAVVHEHLRRRAQLQWLAEQT